MLQYLMWRVTAGLSRHIELAFMVAGHTKFGPDYGFGIFKRLYRHAEVNSIKWISQNLGTEQGEVLIPCFDWQAKFSSMDKIVGIKKFHYFLFDSNKPGVVSGKEYAVR